MPVGHLNPLRPRIGRDRSDLRGDGKRSELLALLVYPLIGCAMKQLERSSHSTDCAQPHVDPIFHGGHAG